MIQAENITKKFGRLHVLKNISFQFEQGACIALLGHNGCGKTTLIKMMLGMVVPDNGHLRFNGTTISGNNWQNRNRIGYMPQIGRYPENMTIAQIIKMMKDIRHVEDKAPDESLIQDFGLNEMMSKKMRTLSG